MSPRIAEHHVDGTDAHRLSKAMGGGVEYTPQQPWPDAATVQWGHGIVPANPFFEAFYGGTFLRGDGETIAEAEERAFRDYQTYVGCDHVWSRHSRTRGPYTNGAGWCVKCDSFKSSAFQPVFRFGRKRRPISKSDLFLLRDVDPELDAIMDAKYPAEIGRRKKRKRELAIRHRIFGVTEEYF